LSCLQLLICFVQEVKDARQHCLHQNVTTNLLKKLHQGKALEAMASTQSEKVNVYKPTGRFNTKKESLKGNVRVYRDRQQANLSFHSHKPISALETTEGVFGVLFYENGSNRGQIKMINLEQHNNTVTVGNGLRYWKWTWSTSVKELGECEIKDFVVLLQKEAGEEGEYTIVTKEWSPAMLEHYDYSSVGINTKPKMEEFSDVADSWGMSAYV
jgi:superfamily II DNA helicase RecQ